MRTGGGSMGVRAPDGVVAGVSRGLIAVEAEMKQASRCGWRVVHDALRSRPGMHWRPALLLAGALLAAGGTPPVEAQLGRVVSGVVRPMFDSGARITDSQRQRLLIKPTLTIDPRRRMGVATGLSADSDRRLVLAVHGDGAAYLWDLDRGVRIDGGFSDVTAGTVRHAGLLAEIVTIHRDGSARAQRLGGEHRTLGPAIDGFDAGAVPAVSGDGTTMAFRTRDGRWHDAAMGARPVTLPDAAREARPFLSPDGSAVVYRAAGGTPIAGRIGRSGVRVLGLLDGCKRGTSTTAGTFAPDGTRVVLGDARGRLCVWSLAGEEAPRRLFTGPRRLDGAVEALAMNGDGSRVAARDASGKVEIWRMSIRKKDFRSLMRVRGFPGGASLLLLDTSREWLFSGEPDGTIGIHSYASRKARKKRKASAIGRLVSTVRGWAVLDRRGRFDGSQGGIDALGWSGRTRTRYSLALPADAFSESYYEPGLLAKLDAPERSDYLTTEAVDLPGEGYLRPPEVVIDPIPVEDRSPGDPVPVTVRVAESDYPADLLATIRLYHNEKLVPDGRFAKTEGIGRFTVRLAPGGNELRAVGVGDRNIDGPLSPVTTIAVAAPPPAPKLRVVAIGIGDYANPSLELSYPPNDVRTLVETMRERSGGLFSDVDTATLLDASADRAAIERILDAPTSPHDVLVVYYSGHGVALREEDYSEWYMVPFAREWATVSFRAESVRRLGLSSKHLMQLLTRARAQRVFLVLDSCHSGAAAGAFRTAASSARDGRLAVEQKSLRRLARVGGIHVLAASQAQEKAKELMAADHGALTYLVLESLQGEADGVDGGTSDGQVSVREIVDYASREMPTLGHRLGQYALKQRPMGYSRGADFSVAEL